MTERTSVIEVGDELANGEGWHGVVHSVTKTRYGLLVGGWLTNKGRKFEAFFPLELPPSERIWGWHNWPTRGTATFPDRQPLGFVALAFCEPYFYPAEEYDAEWERTIEAMRSEEMQSRPTDIRMD